MRKQTEKVLFLILACLTLFSIIFFSVPMRVISLEPIIICGVWYPPLPVTAHDFEYESNCCIVIDPSQIN